MKVRSLLSHFALVAFGLAGQVEASTLPPNNLDQEDILALSYGIEEFDFNETISYVESIYAPIVRGFGANLVINRYWSESEVNAYARRSGNTWFIDAYGGLARRQEISSDGFALVLCHELGHHLGGYPFRADWATSEGGADYFATMSCARTLWQRQTDRNASFRESAHPAVKAACDRRWASRADQDLCYRISSAGKSLADFFAGTPWDVSFDRKDRNVVPTTVLTHPAAQCRLDTYVAGAVCTNNHDRGVIPGLGFGNSVQAESATLPYSCTQYEYDSEGFRPNCWFKPLLRVPSTLKEFHGGCSFPQAQSNECHSAIHQYVAKKGLGGAGVAQEIGSNVFGVAVVQPGFWGDVSIATLRSYQPGCTFPNAQSNECVSAVYRFCSAKGFGMGLTQEIGNQVYGVACFHSAWYGDISMNELRGHHAGCQYPQARSNECVSAIHRACGQRGFSAGLAQEIGNNVYGVGCFQAQWFGDIQVNP